MDIYSTLIYKLYTYTTYAFTRSAFCNSDQRKADDGLVETGETQSSKKAKSKGGSRTKSVDMEVSSDHGQADGSIEDPTVAVRDFGKIEEGKGKGECKGQ
ncbi:hypothetical protein VTL71DRAFT_16493 [Oculimacula yallundae]|uniref:Uncharacterized protein n=1 Tax=Oculimacula yallundae TaxID=86028 RepID=A0ABR4CF74_9HELO